MSKLRKLSKPTKAETPKPIPERVFHVGVDLSLTDTGIAIFDHFDECVLKADIKTKPDKAPNADIKRQKYIVATLASMIFDNCQLADRIVVAIEDYAFSRTTGKSFTRAELGGLFRHWVYDHHFGLYLIKPNSLKEFVTGKGNASKEAVCQGVFSKWGEHFTNDNQADAYAAARYIMAFRNGERLIVECLQR